MPGRVLQVGSVALLLLTVAATNAGGWAVVTVSDLPESMTVGQPVTIEYTVRQHGVAVLTGLPGSVVASSAGRNVAAVVKSTGGRYTATFTPAAAGDWTIAINSGFLENGNRLDPIPAVAAGATVPAAVPAERGRHLFVAKGCVSCHLNRDIVGSGSFGIGPELTRGRLAAEYIGKVLVDPSLAVVPPGTSFNMPNLDLKPAEVAALVAYLTHTDRTVAAGQ